MISEIKKGKVKIKKEGNKIILNDKFKIDHGICNKEQFMKLLKNENNHLMMSILIVIDQVNATDELIIPVLI